MCTTKGAPIFTFFAVWFILGLLISEQLAMPVPGGNQAPIGRYLDHSEMGLNLSNLKMIPHFVIQKEQRGTEVIALHPAIGPFELHWQTERSSSPYEFNPLNLSYKHISIWIAFEEATVEIDRLYRSTTLGPNTSNYVGNTSKWPVTGNISYSASELCSELYNRKTSESLKIQMSEKNSKRNVAGTDDLTDEDNLLCYDGISFNVHYVFSYYCSDFCISNFSQYLCHLFYGTVNEGLVDIVIEGQRQRSKVKRSKVKATALSQNSRAPFGSLKTDNHKTVPHILVGVPCINWVYVFYILITVGYYRRIHRSQGNRLLEQHTVGSQAKIGGEPHHRNIMDILFADGVLSYEDVRTIRKEQSESQRQRVMYAILVEILKGCTEKRLGDHIMDILFAEGVFTYRDVQIIRKCEGHQKSVKEMVNILMKKQYVM